VGNSGYKIILCVFSDHFIGNIVKVKGGSDVMFPFVSDTGPSDLQEPLGHGLYLKFALGGNVRPAGLHQLCKAEAQESFGCGGIVGLCRQTQKTKSHLIKVLNLPLCIKQNHSVDKIVNGGFKLMFPGFQKTGRTNLHQFNLSGQLIFNLRLKFIDLLLDIVQFLKHKFQQMLPAEKHGLLKGGMRNTQRISPRINDSLDHLLNAHIAIDDEGTGRFHEL